MAGDHRWIPRPWHYCVMVFPGSPLISGTPTSLFSRTAPFRISDHVFYFQLPSWSRDDPVEYGRRSGKGRVGGVPVCAKKVCTSRFLTETLYFVAFFFFFNGPVLLVDTLRSLLPATHMFSLEAAYYDTATFFRSSERRITWEDLIK